MQFKSREFKFRAWMSYNLEEEEIAQGYPKGEMLFSYPYEGKREISLVTFSVDSGTSLENLEIMQWTGEKDNTGKDIYDGDIVESYKRIYLIAWAKAYSGFQWCLVNKNGEPDEFYGGLYDNMRVIGNIFENPELIEKIR